MDIKCPTCKHRSTERLALSYAKGDSRTTSTSASLSLGIGALLNPLTLLKALFGFITIGRSWGHSQTTLASETQPPEKFRYWLALPLMLAAALAWAFGLAFISDDATPSWVLVLREYTPSVVFFGYLGLALWYNFRVWPKKEAAWQKTFMCRRCGTVFESEEFEVPENVRSDKRKKGRFLPAHRGK